VESNLSKPLDFTGERFTPECVREIWYEHFHRYVVARDLVGGLDVLDAACGEGYGSALLATVAHSVTGVDLSQDAIKHASARYAAEQLTFQLADCLALPFEDDKFDCVVSFETLEHLQDHQGLMAEFRRVMKPGGFLLISSPDKAVYTDQQENQNEFHVRELYRFELEALLQENFPAYRLWGQKLLFQSVIWSIDGKPGVSFQQENNGQLEQYTAPGHDPVYFIAMAAANADCLPQINDGLNLFDDANESVYKHYYHEIRKNMAAGELLIEKDRELAELKTALQQSRSATGWWSRLLGKS
jgi:SAM-dependent methyltransferase